MGNPWIVILAVIAVSGTTASFADQGGGQTDQPPSSIGDLPGGLSVESAVRQVNANIEDWKDELTKSKASATSSCGAADFWGEIFPWAFRPVVVPPTVDADRLMANQFQNVQLDADEAQALKLALAHDSQTKLDQIEIEIELRDLSIQVSNRTYASAIQVLQAHSGAEARCQEMDLRIQRDHQLIQAGQELIDAYGRYESESTAVMGGAEKTDLAIKTPPPCNVSSDDLAKLKTTILAALKTGLPNEDVTPFTSIFHTNYDFHSSIHAHWALLALARVTGDKNLTEMMRTRLGSGVESGLQELLSTPTLELPYGRAWFLLLLHEMHRQDMTTPAIEKLGASLREQVLSWLEDPTNKKQSFEEGAYQSWTMALLLTVLSTDAPVSDSRLLALVEYLKQNVASLRGLPAQVGDFMSPADAAFVILAGAGDSEAGLSTAQALAYPDSVDMANAHEAGREVSRIWSVAESASLGDPEACKAELDDLHDVLTRPYLWNGDFMTVAHWVPQFMTFAALLGANQI